MEALYSAFRYSLRNLAHAPGFAAVTVLVLALGIGAATTVFTLINGLYLAPPPQVADPDGLVRLNRVFGDSEGSSWSYPDFDYFRQNAAEWLDLATYSPSPSPMTATLSEKPVQVALTYVSDNYFDLLGVPMAAGRGFVAEENVVSGSPPALVLSHAFWQRAYGGAEDAVGSVLRLNQHPFTIVGVAPPGFHGVSPLEGPPDVWTPTAMQPVLSPGSFNPLERRSDMFMVWLRAVGRPRPGVELQVAQEKVDALTAVLAKDFPKQWDDGAARLRTAYRLDPRTGEKAGELMRLLSAAVGLVLAIAAANAALLLLARASARQKEIGVRLALGAGRGRIFLQLLADSLVLAVCAGLAGYALAFWSADAAAAALPFEIAVGMTPDARVLAFTLAASVVTALGFGLVPAWQTARVNVLSIIREGDALSGRSVFRDALVVAQIALSIVLVSGAALFVRSLHAATSVDLGFEVQNRLAVQVNLRQHGYDEERSRAYLERALAEVEAVPGVRRASAMMMAPFRGMMMTNATPEGHADDEDVTVHMNYVGPRYFETMGIGLSDGRDLTAQDRAGSDVAIVSATAAAAWWPGEPAVGRRLKVQDRDVTIVGVAPDVRYRDLEEELPAYVYLPLLDGEVTSVHVIAETDAAPRTVMKAVEERMRTIDPEVAIVHVSTLAENVERLLAPYRVGATLVSLCGVLGLVLASVGLYGVLSYLVVRRTKVIGIQMALGATARRVASGVVRRAVVLVAVGLPIGLGAAWFLARLVERFLFQVEARDPLSFAVPPLVLVVVAVLASALPAWRAARVDPMEALREE